MTGPRKFRAGVHEHFSLFHLLSEVPMSKQLRALLERKQKALAAANAINAKVTQEAREPTDEERTQLDAHLADINKLNGDIERQRQLDAAEASMSGIVVSGVSGVGNPEPLIDQDPRRGFASFGEFAADVRAASRKANRVVSERLMAAAPTTAANEAVGEDGGYTVPPEFREEIMAAVGAEESLFARTDQIPITRNSLKMPVDEVSSWDTTNGIQAYWEDELDLLAQSKPKLKEAEFTARKITALVPVSSELLEDSTAIDAFLRRKAPEKIGFKVDLGIVRGTGVGQPLGILQSGALISVAKEGGQSADTVVRANIDKMFMRMPANRRRNAVWIINQDIEAQLQSLQFTGTESPLPVFLPAGGYSQQPFDTLKGRPVLYHQAASTLGDQGDIILADLSQYGTVVKRGGIKVDVSMHLYFDADALAYRFILRIGGHPYLSAPIAARAGSNTLSPFVTLDERA
jgi:HK97 family phage major capsid protein